MMDFEKDANPFEDRKRPSLSTKNLIMQNPLAMSNPKFGSSRRMTLQDKLTRCAHPPGCPPQSFSAKEPSRNNMIHGAQEFCRQPRRDEGAYPQRSVTEEQRWMAVKGQADCVMFFLDAS